MSLSRIFFKRGREDQVLKRFFKEGLFDFNLMISYNYNINDSVSGASRIYTDDFINVGSFNSIYLRVDCFFLCFFFCLLVM